MATWDPAVMLTDATGIADVALSVEFRAAAFDTGLGQLRGVWSGEAGDAAVRSLQRHVDAARQLSRGARALERAVRDGEATLDHARTQVLDAVLAAEAAGCTVTSEWSVTGPPDAVEVHAAVVSSQVRALIVADESVARSIDDASRTLVDTRARTFLPVAIGIAWAVDAAVSAMIAAGVLSAGAIAFALIDRFGVDAWETIREAIPDTLFEDAGPVDADGVKDVLRDDTEAGRRSPNRQVGSEEELRALVDNLRREAKATDTGADPKITERYELPDGTMIQVRDQSKSGGMTVDIVFPGSKRITKVHVQ
ncbi:hypothetical protein [Rhodococcoides corynebacterioides]|uniref:hypothetical protein n=1 Tax=Rhodococcoides corynebacterioides TaxID=53972 RepID=UPI001C9B73E4|nr:hypothetical protein [Rhodococcus corynebacterioides]MBY6350829.1 hypothetical protein [Rhodococcus corynebacterioides]